MMGRRAEVKKRKSWIWVCMGILAACAVIKWYSCSVAKSAYYLQQTNLSDCTRWRFICCNRKIAKSTVSALWADCNLLARSKRECLNLSWYLAASAILKRRAQGFRVCVASMDAKDWTESSMIGFHAFEISVTSWCRQSYSGSGASII